MATGRGRTRTVIARTDQLMRAGRVKRGPFPADRLALATQAHGAFRARLPGAPLSNLPQRHDPRSNHHTAARVRLSTCPTMMGPIDEGNGGPRRHGPGPFDLSAIDAARRPVHRKYRANRNAFDSPLVGLPAPSPSDRSRWRSQARWCAPSLPPSTACGRRPKLRERGKAHPSLVLKKGLPRQQGIASRPDPTAPGCASLRRRHSGAKDA